MKNYTKRDLKEFDVVKLRNGNVLMILRNNLSYEGLGTFSQSTGGCDKYLEFYNNDLTCKEDHDRDIMEVCGFNGNYIYGLFDRFFRGIHHEPNYESIKILAKDHDKYWERKEVEEMTLEEVCKALGKEIKIVKK